MTDLYGSVGNALSRLKTIVPNSDGPTEAQILSEAEFKPGLFRLVFHAGDYLDANGVVPEESRFLDIFPLRIDMSEAAQCPVPVLVSPFGYSTNRRS